MADLEILGFASGIEFGVVADDPTVTAQDFLKGSTVIYVHGSGADLYVKQDDGSTTNFTKGGAVARVLTPASTSTFGLGNITLSGEQTLNSFLTNTSVVIVVEQTDKSENGLWISNDDAWTRHPDMPDGAVIAAELMVLVNNAGSFEEGSIHYLKTSGLITVGTTNHNWGRNGASMPKSHISGLIMSRDAGDTDHDIKILPGEARDATNAVDIKLAATITKQIDAVWAVGDDAGGLDTGTVAASTLYYKWLIKRSDTVVVDAIFSLSGTAPTMPTNYDFKRLIGALVTDPSSNIVDFVQVGDYFRFLGAPIADIVDSTITNAAFETGTLSCPRWCLAYFYATIENSGNVDEAFLSVNPSGSADPVDSPTISPYLKVLNNEIAKLGCSGTVLVDGSSQIRYEGSEVANNGTLKVHLYAFDMLTRSQPL